MENQFDKMYNQVFQLLENNRKAEAIDVAQQLVDSNMSDENAWFAYACAKKEYGDLIAASKGYEESIAINPDYILGYIGLGDLYGDNSDFEKAIQFYDIALNIDPINILAMHNKILAVAELNGKEKAVELCQEFIVKSNGNAALKNLLGLLYIEQANDLLVDIPDEPSNQKSETTPGFISLKDIETARQLCISAKSLSTSDEQFDIEKKADFILKCCDEDTKVIRWSKISGVIVNMGITFVFYSLLCAIAEFSGLSVATQIFAFLGLVVPWLCIPACRFPAYKINYAHYSGGYPWDINEKNVGSKINKATDVKRTQSGFGIVVRFVYIAFVSRFYLYERCVRTIIDKIKNRKNKNENI